MMGVAVDVCDMAEAKSSSSEKLLVLVTWSYNGGNKRTSEDKPTRPSLTITQLSGLSR